jgi:spermidine synthase
MEPNLEAMAFRKEHVTLEFYEDAADATVSVERGDGIGAPADVGLRINGKTDASSRLDLSTELLLGHLPMVARPDSKDVFILGLGSGITGGAVLRHPVENLTVAENCEPVVRAAKFFNPWNGGILTDSRTKIQVEDARTLLKLSPQRYDIIITQPSNPWMAGVGSVFSKEYYELSASRLKEGGIMTQWFHLYDMHDGIVTLVLRTFSRVFPYVELWDCGAGDVILMGSKRAWPSSLTHAETTFEREGAREDLARIGIHSPRALLARQAASQKTGFAIAGSGPIQSDMFPILEYEAPRAFYLGITATTLEQFRAFSQSIGLAIPICRLTSDGDCATRGRRRVPSNPWICALFRALFDRFNHAPGRSIHRPMQARRSKT